MKKFLAIVASATVLALTAIPAQAATVEYAGNNTYLGTFAPGQSTSFSRGPINNLVAITDYWIFDFNPAGTVSYSINFNPGGTITSPIGQLYAVTTNQACTTGMVCASTIGAKLADAVTTSGNTFLDFTGVMAGRYAVFYSGTVANTSNDTNYSGQINFRARAVPEPGSLALLGLGLIGLGVARRRKA